MEDLSKPMYISWGQIPYNLGAGQRVRQCGGPGALDVLLAPDRRVYFAGDHTAIWWAGRGAALSSYRVINQLGARVENGGNLAA